VGHNSTQDAALEPGHIVAGTPNGVGLFRKPPGILEAGDVMEVEIDGLVTLRDCVL